MIGALYVHVPFCVRKCCYCDFLSRETTPGDPCLEYFVKRRLRELELFSQSELLGHCETAYIGGGTPTMLGPRNLLSLVEGIRRACPGLQELSCEANPDSLGRDTIEVLAEAGATRISIGVQSLNDAELSALGRIHTASQALDCVGLAMESGLDVSVDLMCAIPHQTDQSWKETLQSVVGMGVHHVSVYPLAIEQGTRFGEAYGHEVPDFNDEDVQANRMEQAERELTAHGFIRYEVASYAKAGKACKHNTAYWTGIPYLGLGDGAASMLDSDTYDVVRRVYSWLPEPDARYARIRFNTHDQDVEFLSEREAWAEDLMLGMRLTKGIAMGELQNQPQTMEEIVSRGLAKQCEGRLVPTHEGWLLGNALFGILWDLA